jgi:hypothetical protein
LINHISFTHFIKPENLYTCVYVFSGLFLVFIITTYVTLFDKKRKYYNGLFVKEKLEVWIKTALIEEWDDIKAGIVLPKKLKKQFSSFESQQFAIDELVKSKKNLSGKAGDNISELYVQLGLRDYSLRKFKSGFWHIKARGIYELYMMDQQDMMVKIYKHTNSANEFIRYEAQTAVIHFAGFEGLRFLDIITTPISDWQQLKLLEQLHPLNHPAEIKNIGHWLKSSNETVVMFALKLADIYQQFQVHEEVVQCLGHKQEKIRLQAVKSLVRIADASTASILCQQYAKERFTNRINILNNLAEVANDNELDFLLQQLNEDNGLLQLAAANVLVKCCTNGMEILKQKAVEYPDKAYYQIYNHVKSKRA